MFTVSAMSAGQEDYYLQLGREDYYLEGGEPPGIWFGQGAQNLGLDGQVNRDQLRWLFAGFKPDGNGTLVQNAGKSDRQPGWDMTLSVPKSVSVLWSAVDKSQQGEIETIVMDAAQRLVGFMEDNIAHTRKGAGGVDVQRAKLASAAFLHHTSRAQDTQLHVHLVTPNAGLGEDGRWGALRSREDFYAHQRTLGALFRADIAHQLVARGVELEPDRFAFKIKGVSQALCDAQSTRRKEIEAYMEARHTSGGKAAEIANLATRTVKGHAARDELQTIWDALNTEHGLSSEIAASIFGSPLHKQSSEKKLSEKLQFPYEEVLADLTQSKSHFAERDFQRVLLESIQADGHDPYAVYAKIHDHLNASDDIVHLGLKSEYGTYTSKELYRAEEHIIKLTDRTAADDRHALPLNAVHKPARMSSLSPEQRAAVEHIVCAPGSTQCLTGGAGTGKTRTLTAARAAWKAAGYSVLGCALAGSAAKELEKGSGIKSRTVASMLYSLDNTLIARMKKNLSPKEINEYLSFDGVFSPKMRAIRNKPLFKKRKVPPVKLTKKTVVVLDEASMLGTHDFARLIAHIDRAGAKLICVGDHRQLPSIEAGGVFQSLVEKYGAACLVTNRRQTIPWMRDAVGQFRDGDSRGALSLYAKAGKLHIADSSEGAKEGLIAQWQRSRTDELKETLILAGTNRDVQSLNLAAQSLRRDKAELGRKSMKVDGTRIFEGDRVLFTKNSRLYDIVNGDFATVEKVRRPRHLLDKGGFTVRLDTPSLGCPERVRVSFEDYDSSEVQLGYASTTHKAQGTTVSRTFVLAGGWMQDRELSYVQMSRHKDDCHIFASQADAGEDLSEMVKAMKQSHRKELAHSHEHRLALELSR